MQGLVLCWCAFSVIVHSHANSLENESKLLELYSCSLGELCAHFFRCRDKEAEGEVGGGYSLIQVLPASACLSVMQQPGIYSLICS